VKLVDAALTSDFDARLRFDEFVLDGRSATRQDLKAMSEELRRYVAQNGC